MLTNQHQMRFAQGWGKRINLTRPRWERIMWPAIIVVAMLSAIASAGAAGIRYNVTASMPLGFYRIIDQAPGVGSIIVFCPPVDHRFDFMPAGSCPHGEAPYMKEVVAGPGDVVMVTKNAVTINGKALASSVSIQQPGLPHALGVRRLGAGQLWVYGSGSPENSFDSRYFGLVQQQTARVVTASTIL